MSENNDEITQLKKRVEELENNWKRALADYRNLEKRMTEERAEVVSFANSVLILKLLSVLDNLELIRNHIDDTGLKLVLNEFKQILSDADVVEMDASGKDFDSNTMEAVEAAEAGKGDENKVLLVLRKGYLLKNKVLRPARVKVGRIKEV